MQVRYVITVFLAIDRDMKTSSFTNLVNLSPSSQSIATRVGFTATVGMCYIRPKIILYELHAACRCKLHCRATVGLWCAED